LYGYDGLVISPGPGNAESMPDLRKMLELVLGKMPVLGICLGHQAIAHFYGASIIKARPMHGKISLVESLQESALLSGIPSAFRVVRYHSLVVSDLPSELLPLLVSREDHCLMAFVHRNLPVMGIQFHPEAHLTEFGLPLLKNWLDVCVKSNGIFSPET
jgi:anthranilate synthase component 2